ncbi:MAG: hypothetical protein COA79_01700 [Planctomycetota bacterium]|nr:MAG: hypothetical protein COA79_01700 [Planctomycetota bacterium]
MAINKRDLYYKTMTPKFLFRMVGIIIVLCLILSTILNLTKSVNIFGLIKLTLHENTHNKFQSQFANVLKEKSFSEEEFITFIEIIYGKRNPLISDIVKIELNKAKNSYGTTQIATHLLNINNKLIENSLLALQNEGKKNTRYANRLLAYHYDFIKNPKLEEVHLASESRFTDANTSRKRLVRLYIQNNKTQKLKQLADIPIFNKFYIHISRNLTAKEMNWSKYFNALLLRLVDISLNGSFILAIISGIFWFGLWLHALRPSSIKTILPLCLLAFLAGAFSTVPTLLLSEFFEKVFDFKMREGLLSGTLYFIMSVGFREEFCKLLCFVPFVPFLAKRGKPLEWLIVAGMVGLGFAVEENINYFESQSSLAGRFLTANVLHVALTAIAGESLCYLYTQKKEAIEHFATTFSMVIVLHGIYDAFIVVNALAQLSFLTFVVLYFILQMYFKRLNQLRDNSYEHISLTTHFIFAITFIFMTTFIAISFQTNHLDAIRILGRPFIELGIIVYAYLYLMPNSIIKV